MESFISTGGGIGRAYHPLPTPALPLPFPCLILAAAAAHGHLLLRQRRNSRLFHCNSIAIAAHNHDGSNGNKSNDDISHRKPSLLLPWPSAIRSLAIALLFSGPLALLKALLLALPPDFSQRWRAFLEDYDPGRRLSLASRKKEENVIYDVNGEVIATIGTSCTDGGKTLDLEIPSVLHEAVVACEDRRFFRHRGIDPRGLARAVLSLSRNGGGSTITQQLAKNVFLNNERTFTRKILEMFLALLIETRLSKHDILHAYLSKIYWGHGIYGIEAAAKFYFGKPPVLLNVGECAMLAGMIPAPEFFSPFRDGSRGKLSQRRALQRMVETGMLGASDAEDIISQELELSSGIIEMKSRSCRAPFFVNEVLFELEGRYGHERLSEGGLKIYTTLDLHMQTFAEMVIEEEMNNRDIHRKPMQERLRKAHNKKMKGDAQRVDCEEYDLRHVDDEIQQNAAHQKLEASMIGIDQSTGGVRVLVGGRDFTKNSFNWATRGYRSPGTLFSPVVYLTALAEGINRRDMLVDALEVYGGKDATGNSDLRPVTAPPIVKLCDKVGADNICRMGKRLGIAASLPSDFTLGLGQFKVTPIELATVYATIAAEGIFHKTHLITKVETQDGQTLEEHRVSHNDRIVCKHAAKDLHRLLQVAIERDGNNRQTDMFAAGKSGMSNGYQDAWFAGFTPDLTCLVWLGYDDDNSLASNHPGGGASHAALIWKRFMESTYEVPPKKRSFLLPKKGIKTSWRSFRKARNR